ncbi:putative nuclear pore complex subunit Nup159 [Talaromyces proteolyticus]|uniref:Nuclear pore complex subunit Nup159 n=1 Tax=Talaromyces proteolyticus TaxID=1131652 RepID=A0AAD4Q5S9_9EURO|nr:putative nuclear pore complex subunit Nup159 [Talaromyces proteolyticus]KAH8704878.1 putative nuclear pore complex subunit Nup159 [Talaromyces proteolyticus]
MAFSLGSSAPVAGSGGAELGPELPETSTTELGFLGVDKDCHIRFLPTPWPADSLPQPTSSLLTVSSTKGLVVGGGPNGLIIATTKSVRDAIAAKADTGVKTKPFQPQGQIPLPSRPTHVAFCAGDSALAVSTESNNRLFVYDSTSLTRGNPQPQISIETNGALRALVPNPAATDELSFLVALVTADGNLLVANLKSGSLVKGHSGPIFKTGVTSVSWSNKGKQMVAGSADGTCVQIDPQGAVKAEIPRPPQLEGDKHVSSLSWLENDTFFSVYTPNQTEDEYGSTPSSHFYIIQRRKNAPFLFQKLPEICQPYGLKRTPAYHFISRFSNYGPGLQCALVVSSTAANDLGLITKATPPLKDADESTAEIFTSTFVLDDIKQAILPLNDNAEDTSTIGLGFDLTSTENVLYDGEKMTQTPLPNVMALNNEGMLMSWWFLYMKAIEAGIPYTGVPTTGKTQQPPLTPAAAHAIQAHPAAGFGSPQSSQSTFGQPSFGQPGFGSPTQPSSFGKPSPLGGAPSFGTTSSLGAPRQPGFGTTSALGGGGPTFGSSTPIKSAAPTFGNTGMLGQSSPQFGKTGFGATAGTTSGFGQVSSLGGKGFSSFASPSSGQPTLAMGAAGKGSGFSSFSGGTGGGFGSAKPNESPFAKPTESPFGKPVQSAFGSSDAKSAFGGTQTISDTKGSFGPPLGGFTLGSTFKRDEKAAEDNEPTPAKAAGAFSLGTSFGNLLNEGSKPSPVESMDDTEDAEPQQQQTKSVFGIASPLPKPSEPLFGAQSQPTTAPSAVAQTNQPPTLFGNGIGNAASASPLSSPSEKTVVPNMSLESEKSIEAPLPPDATSRAVYGPGDTSASSNYSKSSYEEPPLPPTFISKKSTPKLDVDAAPLPPDFLKKSENTPKVDDIPLPPDFLTKSNKTDNAVAAAEDAPLPPDFVPKSKKKLEPTEASSLSKEVSNITLPTGSDGSDGDFEDSGEEITHDVSPPSEPAESESAGFKTSPESSFGGPSLKNSTGGLFTKVSLPETKPQAQTSRPLFGEISRPNLPPPKPRSGAKTPRSPSPVRPGSRKDFLRPEATRSISAPSGPEGVFGRKVTLGRPTASRFEEPLTQNDLIEEEESKAAAAESKRLASEAQNLSSDDEDELRRAELEQPLSPVPTLDPFMPRQEYRGESFKPGIPGQIERLYRDINSMVDTLGLNSRSIASYLLHEEQERESHLDHWKEVMLGDTPMDILDESLPVTNIENIGKLLVALEESLQHNRLQRVQEKVNECQKLLGHDIINVREQCASIQKTLDSYTDTVSIRSQFLSAEQESLQQDLRKASADIQSKLTSLEENISLLRARIADSLSANGSVSRYATKRPTVEAVTSTITTMTSMAESKSGDIDVLEAQMKKLGLSLQGPSIRDASPISTPVKKTGFRVPDTPESDGRRSSYHTPDSASRFRSSLTGSARHSRLRSVNLESNLASELGSEERKARTRRRREVVGYFKNAIGEKKIKVRTMDDV